MNHSLFTNDLPADSRDFNQWIYAAVDERPRVKWGSVTAQGKTPEDRIAEERTFNPELNLFVKIRTDRAVFAEKHIIHKSYDPYRIWRDREWFSIDPHSWQSPLMSAMRLIKNDLCISTQNLRLLFKEDARILRILLDKERLRRFVVEEEIKRLPWYCRKLESIDAYNEAMFRCVYRTSMDLGDVRMELLIGKTFMFIEWISHLLNLNLAPLWKLKMMDEHMRAAVRLNAFPMWFAPRSFGCLSLVQAD